MMRILTKIAYMFRKLLLKFFRYCRDVESNQKGKKYLWISNREEPFEFKPTKHLSILLYPDGQIAKMLYMSGYELVEIQLVITYLKKGMNVLDIGANIGVYSLIANKIVGPTGHVWSFEPSSESYSRLIANLALNRASSVKPVKIALSNVAETMLKIKRDPGYKDGERYLSTRKEATFKEVADVLCDSGDDEWVQVTTLDYYFYTVDRSSPRIDFIKMDVEGVEYSVFRGAQKLLTDNQRILILFECTLQGCALSGHKMGDIFLYLRGLGFVLYGWHSENKTWDDSEEYLAVVGNIWACRSKYILPYLN
ncbi:MAG: FkbM family methyltransferase [Bacteroidia bacterium]|nr:FkbM family methyltransferase [Bacteroidia bacterium]